eukprot:2738370-Pleurochrysis_carterae.AAC.1
MTLGKKARGAARSKFAKSFTLPAHARSKTPFVHSTTSPHRRGTPRSAGSLGSGVASGSGVIK